MMSLHLAASAALFLLADATPPNPNSIVEGAIQETLCKKRPGCHIELTQEAGTGEGGERLEVIELAIDNPPNMDYPCRPHRQEIFFLSTIEPQRDGDKVRHGTYVSDIQNLMALCNDGYGASGIGEDVIEVSDNRLIHHQYGGSAWRWDTTTNVQLSPLKVTSRSTCSFHNLSPGFDATEWNLKAFILKGHRKRFACGPDGFADTDEDAELGCTLDVAHTTFDAIPQIDISLPEKDAASVIVGDCGARADASGKVGYITHGKPGEAKDATLSALFTDATTLVVTVVDDIFYDSGGSWVTSDHLEFWTGPSGDNNCEDPSLKPTQWAVMPMDGTLIKAHGPDAKSPPQVKAHLNVTEPKTPTPMTFVIRFAEKPQRLTVVYSDSDDGRTQERLIATSAVAFGKNDSLGESTVVPKEAAQCELKDGVISRTTWGDVSLLPSTADSE